MNRARRKARKQARNERRRIAVTIRWGARRQKRKTLVKTDRFRDAYGGKRRPHFNPRHMKRCPVLDALRPDQVALILEVLALYQIGANIGALRLNENVARELREFDIEAIMQHYFIAALWSSPIDNERGDDADGFYDNEFDPDDADEETQRQTRELIEAFVQENRVDLTRSRQSDEQIGYDLWLTRNGHGAGFRDRGLGAIGDRLSESARSFGEAYVFKSPGDPSKFSIEE